MSSAATARIAADVGGTFTDIAIFDESNGGIRLGKCLTTPAHLIEGINQGVLKSGSGFEQANLFLHGTTVAINTLLERTGAKTALVTTQGFRDMYEIGRINRPEAYNLFFRKHRPLIDRALRYEVDERLLVSGEVFKPLLESEMAAVADRMAAEGVEAIAIMFMHSYRNPAHEVAAKAYFSQRFPHLFVSASHELSQEYREYERTSTIAANAYIGPRVSSYLTEIVDHLAAKKFAGGFLIVQSTGGLYDADAAGRECIRMLESGPAAGVIATRDLCRRIGLQDAIAFDMGGTTAKSGVILRGDVMMTTTSMIGGYTEGLPVQIPMIDIQEVGTGGGSIARLAAGKSLRVGPQSAGSVPGPVCYGLGGTEPTVTDADTALGRLDPARFAGGALPLYPEKAKAALQALADALKTDAQGAAAGVAEIVDETMASAARVHAVENGKDTAERTLIAFGGAAPLHAARLARKLGMKKVVVPVGAGVGSAFGFLRAPIAYEVVRTRHVRLDMFDAKMLNELFAAMRREAEAVVRPAAPGEELVEQRHAFMRYRGQGHEIAVPLPNTAFAPDAAPDLRRRFEATYETVFGRAIPKLEVEALTWTLSIATARPLPKPAKDPVRIASPAPSGHRQVLDPASGRQEKAAIHERNALRPGMSLDGPALIVEDGTTTVVPQDFTARINAAGQIVLEDTV